MPNRSIMPMPRMISPPAERFGRGYSGALRALRLNRPLGVELLDDTGRQSGFCLRLPGQYDDALQRQADHLDGLQTFSLPTPGGQRAADAGSHEQGGDRLLTDLRHDS